MKSFINYRIVFKVISRNLFILTAALFLCMTVAWIYSESASPFLISGGISGVTGLVFHLFGLHGAVDEKIHLKEAYLTVTLSWIFFGFFGSLPYIFSGSIPSLTNAWFESFSGFTTTGASILTDIEILPYSILFWRSLTHWIGGIGIIVLVILIMPTLHIGGYHLFTLESSLKAKIQPRIRQVGTRVLMIYLILTFSEVILLLLGKMNLFESLCHSFGTIATGGFSPRNTSIAGYSPYIQYVVMLFMLLAGTNFVIHFFAFRGEFKKVGENDELRFYLLVILALGLIISSALYLHMDKGIEESLREGFFQLISIITCTGFATADYLLWPQFAWIIIFFAMFLGGSTGSTAGGIKMARHLILFRNINRKIRQLINPNAILQIRINRNPVDEDTNKSILSFMAVYMLSFFAGTILLILTGVDGSSAAGSVATCMAGIGPGIGTVGPVSNFAHIPETGKWILTFFMLLGRLEIYTVLMLFTANFWRK